jgi:hypothetical protein
MKKAIEEIRERAFKVKRELKANELTEVSQTINKRVEEESIIRDLVDTTPTVEYPFNKETPVWILPSLGYITQEFFEEEAAEVLLATWAISVAKEWRFKYIEEKRDDIFVKAVRSVTKALSSYEEEAFFRTLIPPCTTNVATPKAKFSPMVNIESTTCTKELITQMAAEMLERGHTLKTIMISPEDTADLFPFDDPVTRKSIFIYASRGKLEIKVGSRELEIQAITMESLGVRGKYNINGHDSKWGPFKGKTNETFNDYEILFGNVLDENGNLITAGETQIYGFSENIKDYFKMPITEPYVAYFDPSLTRRQLCGFYGWQTMGSALLNSACISMGIITRTGHKV